MCWERRFVDYDSGEVAYLRPTQYMNCPPSRSSMSWWSKRRLHGEPCQSRAPSRESRSPRTRAVAIVHAVLASLHNRAVDGTRRSAALARSSQVARSSPGIFCLFFAQQHMPYRAPRILEAVAPPAVVRVFRRSDLGPLYSLREFMKARNLHTTRLCWERS